MTTRTALFSRRYQEYSGGHQKVLDYFMHLQAARGWDARIFWNPGSIDITESIWRDRASHATARYAPGQADLIFLAGIDWRLYLDESRTEGIPVINLIQHVRHAEPSSDVYPFLTQRAIRICVSAEVESAILDTGRVNGPTFVIPNGIDIDAVKRHLQPRKTESVYILGNKQPELAQALCDALSASGHTPLCHTKHTPRATVLSAMGLAKIAVLLPHSTEGFYLPALEAMALGCLVVVPDCVGNRGFCRHEDTCLMPSSDVASIVAALEQAEAVLDTEAGERILSNAEAQVSRHGLTHERETFHGILEDLDAVW
ncbi:MAG: glycosyltransferase [Pseudomonadota bacterium]